MSSENRPDDIPRLPLPYGEQDALAPPVFDWKSQDDELKALGIQAAQATNPAIIEDLVAVHARFDIGADYIHRDGTETEVEHDRLRKLLAALPSYIESAGHIEVEPGQAYLLLRSMMTAEQRDKHSETSKTVELLTRAFTWQGRHDDQLDADDQADLGRFLAKAAEGEETLIVRVYGHLSRLGFTSSQSIRFIEQDLFMYNDILNQVGSLTHTLYGAKIDPDVLRESCILMLGDNDYNIMIQNYSLLTDMVQRLVPSLDIPANDLLHTINQRMHAGETLDDIAGSYIGDENQPVITGSAMYDPLERKSRHFTPQPAGQPLELSPLPYRTERSLQDGMTDLGRIAVDVLDYGDGFWVFDPDAEVPTWYSLGGQTIPDLAREAVGHQYPPYPIGEISNRPYLFHCHPEALSRFGNPHADDGIFPPRAIPVIDRLTTVTPSGADYAVVAGFLREAGGPSSIRSFIAHSHGFTEFTFPNDPDPIEEVGRNVRAWRYNVMLEANWKRILDRRKWGGLVLKLRDTYEVAAELVGQLEKKLPQGFSLRLIEPDAQIEPISK